ncbi:MAG: glycosyltransferase family 4 protein [Chloroflexi bacterium]|jgi:glycosyltransferase involved in cell wall biosynthesis|nr:glycosyltransferase family 4 protein [Chloroflexota bacterium]
MNDVLLTISGVIPADIQTQAARGDRPEPDYLAMSRAFGADLLDYPAARQVVGKLAPVLEKIGGPNLVLAWACFLLRRRYRVIFTDGEQVGIPLAMLLKFAGSGPRPRHLMIVHRITAPKKVRLMDLYNLQETIDLFFVYAALQQRFIRERWKVPAERVPLIPFMVDTNFYSPQFTDTGEIDIPCGDRPLISTAGLELRDYPTLLEAVRGLDVQLVIATGSPWSKRLDTTRGRDIPENVLVGRFSYRELRQIYARSAFIVMSLEPVDFQAGITAILEAMAMEKAVICTYTPGQSDMIVDGENGIYVPAKNPPALRAAIVDLLSDPVKARKMGRSGRQKVLETATLEKYVQRLKRYVDRARQPDIPLGDDHAQEQAASS